MRLADRIAAFTELGNILGEVLGGKENSYSQELNKLITNQQFSNPWFTPENVRLAIEAISSMLERDKLQMWTDMYPELADTPGGQNVGIIMAGNIPMVGFHDFLTVLVSGNNVIAKTSSKDKDLIKFIAGILSNINRQFADKISFTEGVIKNFNSIIATGSDNTSRYFEYYFSKYHHIIRKNRNGVAIINGSETERELIALGFDVFSYFGLGCRNVSKIFLPENYDLNVLVKAWEHYSPVFNHHKYANNYEYNKAVYMVNQEPFKDAGFLIFRESTSLSSPVAVLYHEFYKNEDELEAKINSSKNKIQCIAGRNEIPFGKTQYPDLWDYADGIDTMKFLLK